MDQTLLDVAGSARFLLDSCDVSEPMVDINAIAESWGLPVFEGMRSRLHAAHIEVDHRKSRERQRFDVAHELGHVIARHCGLNPTCERTASGIASATLMPDAAWKRDIGRCEWDLCELGALYGVSLAVVVRRVVETRACVVSAWAGERLVGRWRSPWLRSSGWDHDKTPPWEQALAQLCAEHACHLAEDGGLRRAYWVPTPGWWRVVVVSEVEAWEGRTAMPHRLWSLFDTSRL